MMHNHHGSVKFINFVYFGRCISPFWYFSGWVGGKNQEKDQLSPAGAETGTELGNTSSIVMKIYYNSLKLYLVNDG